jgi:hypothetical protein
VYELPTIILGLFVFWGVAGGVLFHRSRRTGSIGAVPLTLSAIGLHLAFTVVLMGLHQLWFCLSAVGMHQTPGGITYELTFKQCIMSYSVGEVFDTGVLLGGLFLPGTFVLCFVAARLGASKAANPRVQTGAAAEGASEVEADE